MECHFLVNIFHSTEFESGFATGSARFSDLGSDFWQHCLATVVYKEMFGLGHTSAVRMKFTRNKHKMILQLRAARLLHRTFRPLVYSLWRMWREIFNLIVPHFWGDGAYIAVVLHLSSSLCVSRYRKPQTAIQVHSTDHAQPYVVCQATPHLEAFFKQKMWADFKSDKW